MNCEKCHFENEQGAKFCENCGHILGTQPVTEERPAPVKEEKVDLAKATTKIKTLSKMQKIGIVSAIVVVLLMAGGFAFAEDYYSRENQISRYIETVNTGDAAQIAKVLSTEDLNFELTEESIQPYADYIKEDKEYIQSLTYRLNDFYESEDSAHAVYLKENGKDLFFFNHYDLMINPVYGSVNTNMEGAVITLNGKEIGTSDQEDYTQKIGPLSPGKYAVASAVEQYGVPLTNEQQVFLSGTSDMNYVDLSLSGVEVGIESNIPDAKVYLNDTEIGQLKNGVGSFGPISWQEDSVLTLKKEFANETLESSQVTLEEYDEHYSIDFAVLEESSAQNFLDNIYYNVENISYYGAAESADSDKVALVESMNEGEENAMYKTLYNTAVAAYDDETISNVNYDPVLTELKQIDAHEYEPLYDLTVDTNYTYDSDKEDSEITISFKVNLTLDNFRESDDYYDEGFDVLVKSFEVQE